MAGFALGSIAPSLFAALGGAVAAFCLDFITNIIDAVQKGEEIDWKKLTFSAFAASSCTLLTNPQILAAVISVRHVKVTPASLQKLKGGIDTIAQGLNFLYNTAISIWKEKWAEL